MIDEKNRPAAPTVAFVAAGSNAGKTTLIEKLIPVLRRKGYRVGVVKHSSKGFQLDRPGKDTYRFAQAGAEAVGIASGEEMALMARLSGEPPLSALLARMPEVDLILIEGFRREAPVRIEVYRSGMSAEPLCLREPGFLALVSDVEVEGVAIPRFHPEDVEWLADFLAERLLPRQ